MTSSQRRASAENGGSTYPCPACGAVADEVGECPGCGRPPDPDAAEVVRLNATITRLRTEVENARHALELARAQLEAVELRRNAIATRVRTRLYGERAAAAAKRPRLRPPVAPPVGAPPVATPVGAPPPVAPPVGGPPLVAPSAGEPPVASVSAPETSQRTIQIVLFVLGGLLLGSAAIVFTAVAWARFGVAGRAAILATITGLVLATPPLAAWRRLVGAAETFAALGLLLVALDGYAVWYVNLAGLANHVSPTAFAAGVLAVTAAVSLGYANLPLGGAPGIRVAAPRFCAMVAAQPVPPLLAVWLGADLSGWALVLAGLAAGDAAAAWSARRRGPTRAGRRAVAWVATCCSLLAAAVTAAVPLVTANGFTDVATAAAVVALVVVVMVGVAFASESRPSLDLAAAMAVVVLAAAGVRVVDAAVPGNLPVVAGGVALLAAVITAALPRRVGHGPRSGAYVVVGVVGLPAALVTLVGGAIVAGTGLPVWRDMAGAAPRPFTWHLPVVVVLVGGALGTLLGRPAWRALGIAVAVSLTLAIPSGISHPWWLPSAIDGTVAAAFAIFAVMARRRWQAAILGTLAVALAGHAFVVGLAVPAGTRAVTLGLLIVAIAIAGFGGTARSASRGAASAIPAAVGAGAVVAGVLMTPVLAASVARLAAGERRILVQWLGNPTWSQAAAVVGLAMATAALAIGFTRRTRLAWLTASARSWYLLAGSVAVAVAGLGIAVAAALAGPFTLIAAVVVLCDVIVGLVVLNQANVRERNIAIVAGVAPATLVAAGAVISVLSAAITVFVAPYGWLGAVWTGGPAGVGIAPGEPWREVSHNTALAIGVLTLAVLAAAVFRRVERAGLVRDKIDEEIDEDVDEGFWDVATAARWGAAPLALTAMAGCVAFGAPWPTLAAVSLAIGVACWIASARTRSESTLTGWDALAAATAGPGLAGSLATSTTTIVALGVTIVVGVGVGVAGRRSAARTSGWVTAATALGLVAVSAAMASGVSLWWSGYWLLLAAFVTLAASALLTSARSRWVASYRVHGWSVEVTAHAMAAVALTLTVGSARHAAGVCTAWGLALGLRALYPRPPATGARVRVIAATGCELLGYWLLLVSSDVSVVEAYTLPAAAIALAGGWVAIGAQPALHSWMAYGPGLLAGVLPSLAPLMVSEGAPARRLGLGAASVALVLVGSMARRQAPVIVGGGVLVAVAFHETVVYWDTLPRWVPLAVGGLVLVTMAVTYERRRRDLARLRESVGGMR